jgi:hypothetical protein
LKPIKLITYLFLSCVLFILSQPVLAQVGVGGVMAFGAIATEIPTMSAGMLIVMSFLIAVLSFRLIKKGQKNSSNMTIILLVAIGVFSFGYGSIQLVSNVNANGYGTVNLDLNTTPTQVDIRHGGSYYKNISTQPVIINSINKLNTGGYFACINDIPDPRADFYTFYGISDLIPQCSVGLTLDANKSCVIVCAVPI